MILRRKLALFFEEEDFLSCTSSLDFLGQIFQINVQRQCAVEYLNLAPHVQAVFTSCMKLVELIYTFFVKQCSCCVTNFFLGFFDLQ